MLMVAEALKGDENSMKSSLGRDWAALNGFILLVVGCYAVSLGGIDIKREFAIESERIQT